MGQLPLPLGPFLYFPIFSQMFSPNILTALQKKTLNHPRKLFQSEKQNLPQGCFLKERKSSSLCFGVSLFEKKTELQPSHIHASSTEGSTENTKTKSIETNLTCQARKYFPNYLSKGNLSQLFHVSLFVFERLTRQKTTEFKVLYTLTQTIYLVFSSGWVTKVSSQPRRAQDLKRITLGTKERTFCLRP